LQVLDALAHLLQLLFRVALGRERCHRKEQKQASETRKSLFFQGQTLIRGGTGPPFPALI